MAGLASVSDLQTLMKTTFSGDDLDQASLVLNIVSSWVRVVSGQLWPDAPSGVPYDVIGVVLAASRRELKNPDGAIASKAKGPFSVTYSAPPPDFFTPAELAILKRFRRSAGLRTIGTTRGEHGRPDIGFLQFGNGDVLFPAFTEGELGFMESIHCEENL